MSGFIKKIIYRLRGEVDTKTLVKNGMKVGANFQRMSEVWLDPGHCWQISIGDNVTLAPRVMLIAHDASPQKHFGVTRVGNINVGNNVFIGANTVVLPGVTIGSDVIIGAGSVVTRDIPGGSVAAGNPAKVISTIDEYKERVNAKIKSGVVFGQDYLAQNINDERKNEMRNKSEKTDVFVQRYKK